MPVLAEAGLKGKERIVSRSESNHRVDQMRSVTRCNFQTEVTRFITLSEQAKRSNR